MIPLASHRAGNELPSNWLPVCLGLACLYLPTYYDLYRVFWVTREGAYSPVMLCFIVWLVWRQRDAFSLPRPTPLPALGMAAFAFGLLAYILGRSQSFYNLEVGSQLPLLFGLVYLMLGRAGLKRLWFPILLLVFVVPIPGSLLDQILLPLKELVSRIVDSSLYAAGYPIARNGVVLMIGPYSLLIADACSGLNSLIAISGIGLIYVYLTGHSSRWVNGLLLLSVVPIAFLANIVRVMALVLVTFYFGDGAGSSFHDQAGYLEIAVAFGAFFLLDAALGTLQRHAGSGQARTS
jgi:exosortase B